MPRSSLDGGNDLARYAKFCEGGELRQAVASEVADCFPQSDHAFLNHIVMVRTGNKIGSRLSLD
jgi:hypothetical protein